MSELPLEPRDIGHAALIPSRHSDNLLRLPTLIAFCVPAAKSCSAPYGAQCDLNLGEIRQDGRPAQTSMAKQMPAAAVEKIYDLVFDRHPHGTQLLLHRNISQPPRERPEVSHTKTRANRVDTDVDLILVSRVMVRRIAAANASARGQRSAILAGPLRKLTGFGRAVDCLSPVSRCNRIFAISDLAKFDMRWSGWWLRGRMLAFGRLWRTFVWWSGLSKAAVVGSGPAQSRTLAEGLIARANPAWPHHRFANP